MREDLRLLLQRPTAYQNLQWKHTVTLSGNQLFRVNIKENVIINLAYSTLFMRHSSGFPIHFTRREMKVFGISVHVIEPGATATNFTEADNMTKAAQKVWDRVPESIKRVYGKDYLQISKQLSLHHAINMDVHGDILLNIF